MTITAYLASLTWDGTPRLERWLETNGRPNHEPTPTGDPHETICTWPWDGRAPRKGVRPCNRTDCPHCRPNHGHTSGDPHET